MRAARPYCPTCHFQHSPPARPVSSGQQQDHPRAIDPLQGSPEFTVFGRKYDLLEGSPGVEFVPELKPFPGEPIVQKTSHDCFYTTTMESVLEKYDLRPCRDTIVVTGIGSNNCVYHAVIGFHIRNFFITVAEDCIHAKRPEGQAMALGQFRSSAYNFNVTVARCPDILLAGEEETVRKASLYS